MHVEEIQENLAKYAVPPPGTQCDEKSGWLSKDFDSYCREIINKQVRLELRKMLKIPENREFNTVFALKALLNLRK